MRKILFLFLLISSISHAQVNLNLGLRAYYPFSGNANDASGNNNNPVFNNATLTADRLGNPNSAYHFNGVDNYMKILNSPSLNMGTTMSIAIWVKPTGFYTGPCYNNMMLAKEDADYVPGAYSFRFSDAVTGCTSPTTTHEQFYSQEVLSPAPIVALNQWYSLVYTNDGTTAKMYVNCVLQKSVPAAGLTLTSLYDLYLGHLNNAQYPYWLNGDLDEVRIYDRALNEDEVYAYGACTNTIGCNNWLKVPSYPSSVSVGDLDITGNQLTVEASFSSSTALNPTLQFGKIVSKHTGPSDVNYSLMGVTCEITTSNGYVNTPVPCAPVNDKLYHVAMVYDGAVLKFYRNGYLLSSVPWSGNLVNNNWPTTIGSGSNSPSAAYQQLGYINEVRIWNVARTQAQIQTYMNSSLPSPATQTGLKGYYTFDDLLNKQGNAAFNGTLNGSASINAANPNCTFVADSCSNAVLNSVIINDYTPVLALNPCNNSLTVEDGTKYNTGDTVLLIQMKGAVIDSTNTAAFGTITNYKNAGNYEFNYVKSRAGNVIELLNVLTRQYDIPDGKVQLVRVPYYTNANITSTLTCLPWDGKKGGVLALNVANTLTLNADIDVTGKGFRGGNNYNVGPAVLSCFQTNYFFDSSSMISSRKGEGIATISSGKLNGRGPLANGGGGGNGHNSGGGGGSNAAIGGLGGYQLYECNNSNFDNRGLNGVSLTYSNAANKIYLGGGGGGGHKDGLPTQTLSSAGGDGGGIIILNAKNLTSNSHVILANGAHGKQCDVDGFTCLHDGMGGGGGAGTIMMNVTNYLDNHQEKVIGGKGADLTLYTAAAGHVGPGGGGGGGVVWFNAATLPPTASVTNTGGANGTILLDSNNPFGATSGSNGFNLFNLAIPISATPFKPNIDSVRFNQNATNCKAFNFFGFGYTNTNPVNTWQWDFGDGNTAGTQNTAHTYTSTGTFNVKLVVTDINGCKDSIIKPVVVTDCNIINDYTPVLALNPCNNSLTVEDGTKYNAGDTVLIIQMKGAVIDSTNTAAFGTITDYKNAGNYEFNYVKSRTGNVIELKDFLTRQYDIPVGKVQLIRVPYYNSINITTTLSCLPWDGNKGGVLVVNAKDTIELNADINTTGKGFLKGTMHNSNFNGYTCGITNYYFADNTMDAAGKGEGISFLSPNRNSGKGPAGNGGGGGMNTNSGGGGGSNGNAGGRGGYEWNNGCPNYLTSNNWGKPGNSLLYNNANNKIFMGGGGGAGHCNNQYDAPGYNTDFNGANGGGIVILNADYLKNNSSKIISEGDTAYVLYLPSGLGVHDGMGGGGAGGTVLLNVNNYINNLSVDVAGGKGANMNASTATGAGFVGPGGGGGGGVLWTKQSALPANISVINTGGNNGVITQGGNTPYGAAPGLNGINIFSLNVPVAITPFKANIDSVRFTNVLSNCSHFDFNGLGYTNTYPIATWQWDFGDGNTAGTQNTAHTYTATGPFNVKLVATDINGCKDSIILPVSPGAAPVADAGLDTAFCSNAVVNAQLHGNSGATSYSWTPAAPLNNSSAQNPVATISASTRFYLTVTNTAGCTGKDSVDITVNALPVVKTLNDTATCKNAVLILSTTPGLATYQWTPAIYVDNPSSANPAFIDVVDRTLYVTGTDINGCIGKDTINITVKPLPNVKTIGDTTICNVNPLTLYTTGAQTYSWTPATELSDPSVADPVFFGNQGNTYYVTGTGANGCKASDTVKVTVNILGAFKTPPDKTMCAHASAQLDGANDPSYDYLWSPGAYLTSTTIINPVATPPFSTAYNVNINDKVCRFAKDFTVKVTVDPLPFISAGKSNDIDCAHHTATLSAYGFSYNYTWSPATGLSSTTAINPIAKPAATQQYILTAKDSIGCTSKDSVTVYVKTAESLSRYMPNAFTPNGDGHNDCYGLQKWMYIKNLQFMIYNRWGEKVFSTNNQNDCWDGNYKGKPASGGAYVFYIKAETECGTEEQKGNFILIR